MAFRAHQVMAVLAAALVLQTAAQIPLRDPLTPQEAEQVRNTAGRLDQRVPLLLRLAQQRLVQFEQIRAGSSPGRLAQMYALLRQYQEILPELNDAMDDLSAPPAPEGPKYKVAKVLGPVIAQEQLLLAQLQHIQSSSSPGDLATYHFELQNCIDATRDSLQNAKDDIAGASAHA